MKIVISARLFATPHDRERSERTLEKLLEVMVQVNADEIREALQHNPRFPWLYQSGIVYERERMGREEWQTYRAMLEKAPDGTEENEGKRVGDCEDLATARAGELRARKGIFARAKLKRKRKGNFYLYHVIVEDPDGHEEDPSKKLGM